MRMQLCLTTSLLCNMAQKTVHVSCAGQDTAIVSIKFTFE